MRPTARRPLALATLAAVIVAAGATGGCDFGAGEECDRATAIGQVMARPGPPPAPGRGGGGARGGTRGGGARPAKPVKPPQPKPVDVPDVDDCDD